MVTAGTFLKLHHFKTKERLQYLHDKLLELSDEYNWKLHAWAVFSNHYHFIAEKNQNSGDLNSFLSQLHSLTAGFVNDLDGTKDRQVWYQYWDTYITFSKSYMARMNYVMQNPVKHGIVTFAKDYPYCSARWFEEKSQKPLVNTIKSFKIDRINIMDEF